MAVVVSLPILFLWLVDDLGLCGVRRGLVLGLGLVVVDLDRLLGVGALLRRLGSGHHHAGGGSALLGLVLAKLLLVLRAHLGGL